VVLEVLQGETVYKLRKSKVNMTDVKREMGRVVRTDLGTMGNGWFTLSLTYDYKGGGQGIPLYGFGKDAELMGGFIKGLLSAHGVDTWEELKGRLVWVHHTNSDITKIEPLELERGKEFDIKAWADKAKEDNGN
jgi:hypothetical protein